MMAEFHGFYDGVKDKQELEQEFYIKLDDNIRIVYAVFNSDGYEVDAFIIYYDTNDKKYYEVRGYHCSCFGFEDQWQPTEMTLESMQFLVDRNAFNNIEKTEYWHEFVIRHESFLFGIHPTLYDDKDYIDWN